MKENTLLAKWLPDIRRMTRKVIQGMLITIAIATLFLSIDLTFPQSASAYPFWAQQNYENPREATGRLACANCHLAEKKTIVEAPQAVLPDSVFKTVVKIPYDLNSQQILGDGGKGGLNVGAVLMLPEGFKIAPPDRIPEKLKEEVGSTYFVPYSEDKDNIVLVGPLPGDQYQEIVFPVLSPDPATDKSINFGKYSIHAGGNRGRGQVYPTGEPSNNIVVNSPATGKVTQVSKAEDGSYQVTIQPEEGAAVVGKVPTGLDLIVASGDEVIAGSPLNADPNVGGFGQMDTEIVLQSSGRVAGLIAFLAAVTLSQILLVLKKKQVERVQEAEMSF